MERAICERCGEPQPRDWAAGDLCIACGAAVRREVRCAWCAEWIPAGRFCRACGCEVVSPGQYGAARMLKSAGVDRFSIAQRLGALDPEQVVNLGRIYNAQLAVVARRVEECRLVESGLLQKTFSRRLEEELVPRLPMEKEDLAALAAGPAGPFHAAPDLLAEIARRSPLEITRLLAAIALFRAGCFKNTFAAARQALDGGDPTLALEAALAFAHWRVRLYPYELWRPGVYSAWTSMTAGIERQRLAEVAGAVPRDSPLRSWAAAAMTLAKYGEYGVLPEPGPSQPDDLDDLWDALRQGLSSSDPDLRFTCAMAIGEQEIVARALDSQDAGQGLVARTFLARNNSPLIAPYLIGGPEEVRKEVLCDLWSPLPGALVEPVLQAVEKGAGQAREAGVCLLLSSLTEAVVDRLIRVAQRENDAEVFRSLVKQDRLPGSRKVVCTLIRAGWFMELRNSLCDEHVDFADEALLQLAGKCEADVLEGLVAIADHQVYKCELDERPGAAVPPARFLTRIAFSARPATIRETAFRRLDTSRVLDWMSASGIQALFGNLSGFLEAVTKVFQEPGLGQVCHAILEKLSSNWDRITPLLDQEQAALKRFIATLEKAARGKFHDDTMLQAGAASLLVRLTAVSPAAALEALAALLGDCGSRWQLREVPAELLAGYDALARGLGRERALAAKLAEALIRTLTDSNTLQQRNVPAIELLTNLARDHAGLRKRIAAGMAPVLSDLDFLDRDVRDAADELLKALEAQ